MAAELSNPFPGLRSFEPEEEHLFFGREAQTDELLRRLRRTRFLTVVGASGSGKSSLVRSGLIPSLQGGYMVGPGSSWRIAIARPGEDPIANLASKLARPENLLAPGMPANIGRGLLDATLRGGARGLVETVRKAAMEEDENLLIVIDQFEELFRFKSSRKRDSAEEAAGFTKLLLEASEQQEVPIYVVLTMRSEYLGDCTEFRGLADAINEGLYLIPRMSREQRRSAIEGPVAVARTRIAPQLVLRLLNEVGDDPDQLPILQHALMRTWGRWRDDHSDGEPIDWRHYDDIGTMAEALSRHADRAYRELETEEARRTGERLFKSLTEMGEDGRGIRRPLRVEQACAESKLTLEEVETAVKPFRQAGRSFLKPEAAEGRLTPDSILDISHESLMRKWQQLRSWVEEEAQGAQIYRDLVRDAALFQQGKESEWQDPKLQLARDWQRSAKPTVEWAGRYDPAFEQAMGFLEQSREKKARKEQIEEQQREKQLQDARRNVIIFGILFLLAAGLAIWASLAQREAGRALEGERKAKSQLQEALGEAKGARQLAEQKQQEAEDARDELADSLAELAASLEREEQSRGVAEAARGVAEQKQQEAENARDMLADSLKREEDSRVLAETAQADAEVKRLEAERAEAAAEEGRFRELARLRAGQVARLRQEKDAETAAMVALHAFCLNGRSRGDQRIREIYDGLAAGLDGLASGDHEAAGVNRALKIGERDRVGPVRSLVVSGDQSRLAAGDESGGVHLLRVVGDRVDFERSTSLDSAVRSLAFGPGGEYLAAGTRGGGVYLLEAAGGETLFSDDTAHGAAVAAMAFCGDRGEEHAPEGESSPAPSCRGQLASGSADGALRLWQLKDGRLEERPAPPPIKESGVPGPVRVTGVSFAPERARLAVSVAADTHQGEVRTWTNTGDGWRPESVLSAGAPLHSVALGPEGDLVAAGDLDGTVHFWRLPCGGDCAAMSQGGHASQVNALAFSAAGSLVSASFDRTIRLWDRSPSGEWRQTVLTGHDRWVQAVAAGGDHLYSGSADGTLRRWAAGSAVLGRALRALAIRRGTCLAGTDLQSLSAEYFSPLVLPELCRDELDKVCRPPKKVEKKERTAKTPARRPDR